MITADLDVLSSRERPWFAARFAHGEAFIEGSPACLLGHRLGPGARGMQDGLFVEWNWDGERLIVRNDRYGIYPLFYAAHGQEIRISPSMHHVLDGAFPKTLDYPALAVFFRLGFFVGDDTPFEHVRVLPPASTLTWHRGELSLQRGSIEICPPKSEPGTLAEAAEEYAALFRRAIERRRPAGGSFTVPVSGGRDSRHILFELMAQGFIPDLTVTVRSRPPSPNEDIRIARILTRELDLPHDEIDMPHSFFQAHRKDVEMTELCSSGHIWLLPVSAWLKGRTHTVYDGLAGSVLSGGFQVNEERLALFRDGRLGELAARLLPESRGMEAFLSGCLRPLLRDRVLRSAAVDRLTAELERHGDARNPLVSYIFWNRTRRGVGLIPFSILSHVPNVYCPYLDHDLFDFLINLDINLALGNALHDETIRRTYPRYAHIPYEDKSLPRRRSREASAHYRRAARELLAYLALRPRHLGSRLVKTDRVLAMAAWDCVRPYCPSTWYLRPTLYTLRLEEIADGI